MISLYMLDFQLCLTRKSYFIGYIGYIVPIWNFFSNILELGTYSECYCFVIAIIAVVSTFFCFTMFGIGLLRVLRKSAELNPRCQCL